MESVERKPAGPLSDLFVVEWGDGTSGPYAAKLLGDFGAEVVKVEEPSGDSSRRRGPFPDGKPDPEASGLFLYLNVNKFGVTLDLATSEARASLDGLLQRADVFVSNQPAARLRDCGLAPEVLRSRFPRLVVTTVSPFGSDGPWCDLRADELAAFAASGMAYSTPGMPDASVDLEREPPLHPDCFAAETIAGLVAATATMTAVLGRAHTGTGCHVEVSTQAALAAMQIRDVTNVSYTGARYDRLMNPTTIGRMPNFYLPCKDGYVTVAAPMEVHWERLVQAMEMPAWALTEAFATEKARTENWIALRLRLIEWTMRLPGTALHELAEKYQLPIFPFYSIRSLADSGQARERGSLVEAKLGNRVVRMPGPPVAMRRTPWTLRRGAPALGEHNDLVFDRVPGHALGLAS